MSQNVFTKNGWVQTSGNVNPFELQSYKDGGYLPKNLLKITNPNTTNNGITYTVNPDGSVTMNGTASATSIFRIMTNLPNGKYYIHSGIQLSNNLMIQIYDSSNNASSITQDDSVVEKDIVEYRIRVASGQALNNVKIYPMITTKLSAFIPYAQSNVELGNIVNNNLENGYLSDNLANVTSGAIDANGDRVIRVSAGTKTDRIGYEYKENTQYTLSARIKLSDASSQVRFGIEYTDGTTAYTFLSNYSTEYADKVATTEANKTVKSIFLWNASAGDLYIYKDRIQLIEGTSAVPYVPSNVELQNEIDSLDILRLGLSDKKVSGSGAYTNADDVPIGTIFRCWTSATNIQAMGIIATFSANSNGSKIQVNIGMDSNFYIRTFDGTNWASWKQLKASSI